jgi:hypothetical protein
VPTTKGDLPIPLPSARSGCKFHDGSKFLRCRTWSLLVATHVQMLTQIQATLDYSCVCGNGLSPNATEFSQTLPYFICTQYGTNCVAGCGGDNLCQVSYLSLYYRQLLTERRLHADKITLAELRIHLLQMLH